MGRLLGTTRRRLLATLIAAATALAVAIVLGATTVLGHKSSSRTRVSRYITSVDDVQQQMRLPLTRLLSAYRSFSTTETTPATAARLSAAEQTLQTLEARLAALPFPAEAAKLRTLLLELVQSEISVSHELNELARFTPRFHALLAAATAANGKLAHGLAAAAPPKPHTVRGTAKQIAQARAAFAAKATKAAAAQADAVEVYDKSLGRVVQKLRALRPPAVMAPAYRAEMRTVEATRAAGATLAAELRKQNRSKVPELSRALTKAARLSQSVAAQKAEIAAVKAYDARVQQIGKAQGKVQAEVGRLQRALG